MRRLTAPRLLLAAVLPAAAAAARDARSLDGAAVDDARR